MFTYQTPTTGAGVPTTAGRWLVWSESSSAVVD
jgi:hypothetical protein